MQATNLPQPAWLRYLCPEQNIAKLVARQCWTCGRWTVSCQQGVWEAYDPGIIQGSNDLACAIILRRKLTRLIWMPILQQVMLEDVFGASGIKTDGIYLAEHACGLHPISVKPFKPPQARYKPQLFRNKEHVITSEEVKEFEQAWNQ